MHAFDVMQRKEGKPVAKRSVVVPASTAPLSKVPLWQRLAAEPATGVGVPLPAEVQQKMGRAFGFDFSAVRVHQDESALDIGARAYARGNHLHFAPGQYSPRTATGQAVIGHELAHVVQQTEGLAGLPSQQRQGVIVDDPTREREADEMGVRAARGEPVRARQEGSRRQVIDAGRSEAHVQRLIEMPPNSTLPSFHKYLTLSGNVYSYPTVDRTKDLAWEIFTSLLNSPRTFKLQGKNSEEAEWSFMRHMSAREGVVEFARSKKYKFTGGREDFRMNPKYWEWDKKRGKFWSKEGVDWQQAREDLNKNPQEYTIGCAAATQTTVEGGGQSKRISGDTSDDQDWVPGESGFIKNDAWDGAPGLEGENIIYIGFKRFWGHFEDANAIEPYQTWFQMVNNWKKGEGARLESSRQWPSKGLA